MGGGHLLSRPLRGRTGAQLTVVDAAARVTLRTVDLPGLLYRIGTPPDSGLAPTVTGADGAVRLGLRRTSGNGLDTVDILLNRAVRWQLRLTAGAGEQHLDLAAGRVSAIELGHGAGLVRLRLPRPRTTVPIRLTGSAGDVEISAPRGVPVRVRAYRGIATVALGWTSRTAAPAGTMLTPPGWPQAVGRYQVEAQAPIATLTVRS